MSLLKDKSGNIQMVQAAVYLIVLLVVLYIGLTINQNVITSTAMTQEVYATGTLNFTDVGNADEVIVIGTETYTLKAAAAGEFEVTIGGTATLTMDNLVAEITTNSTLVSASNVGSLGTITADVAGTDANAYATTTNSTNCTWTDATLTGGVDGDALYSASADMNGVTESAYGMAGIMPIVMIAVAILASLLGVVYLFR